MSRSRYRIFDGTQPHFLTCTIVDWLPIFTRPDAVQVVLDSWRFLQTHGRMVLFGYVVMENHLDFVAKAENLAKEVKDFKSFTARQIIDLLKSRCEHGLLERLEWLKARHKSQSQFQLWQEGSHPQQLVDEEMLIQKLEYIHNNPVKRGYVDDPSHWRYSSARNYSGKEGLLPVETGWR